MEFKRKQLINRPLFFLCVLVMGIIIFIAIANLVDIPVYGDGEKVKGYISLFEMIFVNVGK